MEYISNKASSIKELRDEMDATLALAAREDNPAALSMPENRGLMTRPFVSAFSFNEAGPARAPLSAGGATSYPANSVDSSQLLMQSIGVLLLSIGVLVVMFILLMRSYLF